MTAYKVIRPWLFKMDAARAHESAVALVGRLPMPDPAPLHDSLAVEVAGIRFPSPVGLAAGFDKDAHAPGNMLAFGFGSVEVGTLTPRPQSGNSGKRVFRLVEDEAVINRMGFNNRGQESAEKRLAVQHAKPGVVGINIGANKDSEDRIQDYVSGVRRLGRYAKYLTLNISSPNTPGLRALQQIDPLRDLVGRVLEARGQDGPPVFLKVSPDLPDRDIGEIAKLIVGSGIDALIVSNTTVQRPPGLKSSFSSEEGGLSGKPLKEIALRALRMFRSEVGAKLPLIGVGGNGSAQDAYERIRAGASLIQVYTAFAYEGPGLAKRMNAGLAQLLRRDGFGSISEAVGADAS